MRRLPILLILLTAAFVPAADKKADKPVPATSEEAYFHVFHRGKPVGYELFTLKPDAQGRLAMETESELLLPKGAGRIGFHYKTYEIMDNTLNPVYFEEQYAFANQDNYLKVSFAKGNATDEGFMGGQRVNRTRPVKPQLRLIEEAVYSLYCVLFKRYQAGKTATQSFSVYIPKVAVELTATVSIESEGQSVSPDGPIRMRRFSVDIGKFQGVMLDVDDQNRVQRIIIPRQEIELVRDPAGIPAGPRAHVEGVPPLGGQAAPSAEQTDGQGATPAAEPAPAPVAPDPAPAPAPEPPPTPAPAPTGVASR